MTQDERDRLMDRFMDRLIEEGAREYNAPPPPPREEMWAVIRERLAGPSDRPAGPDRRADADRSADPAFRRARRRTGWPRWAPPLAAAAMLVAGFGLGRLVTPVAPPASPAVAAGGAEGAAASFPVRVETARHMGEAEAMLTLFRASEGIDDGAATAAWARELLVTTRLLLDSRATRDPHMAQLLSDLELILVQIVHADAAGAERALIEDGIERRQLIAKLRAVVSDPVEMAM